jgi:hypothetical protein
MGQAEADAFLGLGAALLGFAAGMRALNPPGGPLVLGRRCAFEYHLI